MSDYPDFRQYGYQIERELGQNRAGGRLTYLATQIDTQQSVVVKQFQFVQSISSWTGYSAVKSEIQVLRALSSPNIPRYLDAFETPNGFCLVQEYKEAIPLSQFGQFTPQDIKQIAVAVLEVLVYLQQQNPPVIHRDIKPENILIDRSFGKMTVYLVDFGFARLGGGEVTDSSVVKGTLGFMPPEQLFNRQLTEASDLYSLGATLICLLTGVRSQDIGSLINCETSSFNVHQQLLQLNFQFIDWLDQMVAPSLNNRYANAAVALAALKLIPLASRAERRGIAKLRKLAANRELVTFALLALVSIHFALSWIPWHRDPVQQLLKTGACSRCDLVDANLEKANLEGADLVMANLVRANLKGANLAQANLEGAILVGADLVSANLGRANLEGAELGNAYLEGADLVRADLANANLEGADLVRADLVRANLEGANLIRASLERVNLVRANLEGADLVRADLKGANLAGADLQGANLKGANLEGANLESTNLQGVDFEGANLKGTIFPKEAEGDRQKWGY
jgi:uncharacterized protein YjbI with pentapeptide repeats